MFFIRIGYNLGKNVTGFNDFFNLIATEKDISKHNPKYHPTVKNCIKNEYIKDLKDTSKGLFSNDQIMAYLFVFDYEDDNSFNEIFYLARVIMNGEKLNMNSEGTKSVKCFVCNKYPYLVNDLNQQNFNEEVLNQMMENDLKIFEYIQKLKDIYQNIE